MNYKGIMESPMYNLTNVMRYAGLHLNKQESVSDHVWQMISLGLLITPQLNKLATDKKDEVDVKDLIFRIAIHDIDESVSFDIPRLFKYYSEAIHNIIEDTNHDIMSSTYSKELIEQIDNAKDVTTKEGLLVKIFDTFQTWIKMKFELNIGNSLIRSQFKNVKSTIPDCIRLVRESVFNSDQKAELILFCNEWYDDVVKLS